MMLLFIILKAVQTEFRCAITISANVYEVQGYLDCS